MRDETRGLADETRGIKKSREAEVKKTRVTEYLRVRRG